MARRDIQGELKTGLKLMRLQSGISLEELGQLTGISKSMLWRLENKQVKNPKVGYLTNCAIVLGARLYELIEEDWNEWVVFGDGPQRPEKPSDHWRQGRFDDATLNEYATRHHLDAEDFSNVEARWQQAAWWEQDERDRLLQERRTALAERECALDELEAQLAEREAAAS